MCADKDSKEARRDEAGRRALAEADRRRAGLKPVERPCETGGRDGPEPVRFGDWERNGLASDF